MKWMYVVISSLLTSNAYAGLYSRVVDVGSGLCVITEIDKKHYFVYDAGNWTGQQCYQAVKKIVKGNTIQLMVLSHSDSDHIGDVPKILKDFKVDSIVRTGFRRATKTWQKTDAAVQHEVLTGATEYNLQQINLDPGKLIFPLGDASVTILYGKGNWSGLNESENRNAISIVAKLVYKGHSILFTGDTIGRRLTDDSTACKDAEHEMVRLNETSVIKLKSDILIAPHHGGNNSSSACFISAISPKYVIFSAGHDHGHPAHETYKRYINAGVKYENIFRTDLNDAEADSDKDWEDPMVESCIDMKGDDDIDIVINDEHTTVSYRDDGVQSLCKS